MLRQALLRLKKKAKWQSLGLIVIRLVKVNEKPHAVRCGVLVCVLFIRFLTDFVTQALHYPFS
ncbi:hypothetical protein [Moraxella lacunata]|uniref:hypothetical protein n=1 Tax=Moraxella lacunata TaxID=477 RepID=UPI003EDFFD94